MKNKNEKQEEDEKKRRITKNNKKKNKKKKKNFETWEVFLMTFSKNILEQLRGLLLLMLMLLQEADD